MPFVVARRAGLRPRLLTLLIAVLLTMSVAPAHAYPAQQGTAGVSGVVWFDRNANGQREASESLIAGASLRLLRDGQSELIGPSVTYGTYRRLGLAPGSYTLQALLVDFQDPAPGDDLLLVSPALTVTLPAGETRIDLGLILPPTPRDERFFSATGYRIDNDAIWDYFQARGGVATFGYPVSRTFPFLGHSTQIFQRHILQACCPVGSAHPMNLLDPGLMPASSVNFSTFPAHDPTVATAAPPPSAPNYGQAVLRHLQTTVPDTWEGQDVGFLEAYLGAAPEDGAGFRPLVALEVWGFPTSRPARDPNNHRFVFQRFQRGVLHFDASSGVTRGILLADAFKSVLTGERLPADLAAQMAGSPFLRAYDPAAINGVGGGNPFRLGITNLAFAFLPETAERPAWVTQLGGAIYFLREGALWRQGVSTGQELRLLDGVVEFALSPDGRRLAAIRGRGLEAEVWIAAFDGSAAHQVTADQRAEGGLAWSTRNVIAFA
ncbi:MAG: hypothetical protein ACRDJN_00750, partial [Chloroflexota bacterium]